MSNPLKPIKKVFKAVTKVVKKVLPIVAVAAAVYFGGYALANGTLTGSGTHLASMFSGSAGAGSSLFVPGAGSEAAGMIAGTGGSVGGGWLGGSGLPGFGTKESLATINSGLGQGVTSGMNTSLASATDGALMQGPSFQGSQMSAGQFGTGAVEGSGAINGATDLAFGANSSPLATQSIGQGINATSQAATQTAGGVGGFSSSGMNSGLLGGASPNALGQAANNALATGVSTTTTPSKGLIAGAWDGLGGYGKAATVMTAGNAISGYATAKAEEEAEKAKMAEAERIRQEDLSRQNAFTAGRWSYVPGVGLVYRKEGDSFNPGSTTLGYA